MGGPAVPRSRREIREALRALGVRPLKRHGQHFLADGRVLDRIAAAAGAGPGDLVLEVGPGLGGLTARLAATGAAVLAVEIDPVFARFLGAAFAAEPRVRVVESDALDGRGDLSPALRSALGEALAARGGGRFLVAANLPYSVATPLLLALLRHDPPPADLVVMVQREVADRLRAGPGTDAYGPLSVLVQAGSRVGSLFPVPRTAFVPPPAVASAVVRIAPDPALRAASGDPDLLRTAVHGAFGMRRKTVANSLRGAGLPADAALAAAGIDGGRRAETLSVAEFAALARALASLASPPPGGETAGLP
jgi:16S rRNA (adenine1518-N6/adenine1519-N6)-dimethyltransferase